MSFLAGLEERARAENPDVANEYARSRSSSPSGAPLVPLPPPRHSLLEPAAPPSSSPTSASLGDRESTMTEDAPSEPAHKSPVAPVPAAAAVPPAQSANGAVITKVPDGPPAPVKVKKPRPLPKSPPPKKPRKPQPTIRLQIELNAAVRSQPKGGVFEIDFEEVAKERGLRVVQSESEREDSESEGSGGSDAEETKTTHVSTATAAVMGGAGKGQKRRKRIEDRDEGYDTSDSFVDDSELQLDMPKYYVRPARDGFYVAIGQLELYNASTTTRKHRGSLSGSKEDDEPPRKRAKKIPLTSPGKAAGGGKSNDRDDDGGIKRTLPKNAISFAADGDSPEKKPRVDETPPDINRLTPELRAMAENLTTEVANTEFVPKNKFPLRLKPFLHDFALKAIATQQYDDHFFRLLPTIFPYNRFTMEKLTKREIYPLRIEAMKEQQNVLVEQLGVLVPAQIPISEVQWTKDLELYEAKHLKWEADQVAKQAGDDTAMKVDGVSEAEKPISKSRKDKEPPAPTKKLVFSEEMKRVLWEIIMLEDQMTHITNEKLDLEKNTDDLVKDLAARKALYARLVQLFPDEWMTTNILSRIHSQAKLKYGDATAGEEQ